MSAQVLSENRSHLDVAQQRIDSFLQQFGEAHFTFACHAAFPIALTPELLYAIWANFQQDSHRNALDIPWIAVSDFLLSGLCDEAGQELYEMDQATRDSLLHVLEESASLGQLRIQQLAQFLETHVKPKLQSDDPDIRDWAQAQRWTALAYQKPEVAARELAIALSHAYKADRADLIRITAVVEALRNPLAIFKELIAYAHGMAAYARGDLETAAHQFAVVNQTDKQGILSTASVPDLKTRTSKRDSQGKTLIKNASKSLRRQSLVLLQVAQDHWPILTATTITAIVIGFVSGSSSDQLITGLNDVNSGNFFTLFNPLAEPQPEPSQNNVPDTVSSGENATVSNNQNSAEVSVTEPVTETTSNNSGSNNTQGNETNGDANGATGLVESSTIPFEQFPPQEETTIIRFQGPDFATHVLEKGGSLFMNVYERQAEVRVLNGQRAFIEAPRNENDEWRSYLSFGEYRGVPSTFTARVSPQGQTQLEITNRNNGQLLAREDSNLIEGQTTNLLTNDYVVAIPGGQDMLTSVRQFYPEAYLDSSGQSDFVNVGTFGNEDAATARAYALRANNIDAQVVYRSIEYSQPLPQEHNIEIVERSVSSATDEYVVAVPGGQQMLTQVRELYPEAYQDRAEQENFVNVGSFADRNAAVARAYALQAFDIDALIYQQPNGE